MVDVSVKKPKAYMPGHLAKLRIEQNMEPRNYRVY